MKNRLYLFFLSTAYLLIGSTIYITARPKTLLLFDWSNKIGISPWINYIRNSLSFINSFPDWLIYSLPNGLWLSSLITAIYAIWLNDNKNAEIYSYSFIAIALFIELGQLGKIVIGNFDLMDIVFICALGLLSLYINKLIIN